MIGSNLVDHLVGLGDWEVIGLSRRHGEPGAGVRYLSVDLLDPDDCRAKLGDLTDITHIFYAAYQDRPTWAGLVAPNLAMLVNAVDAVEPIAGKAWTWSALRPSVVCGFALGNPMNLAMVIAVYAAISKELGLPLRFPGKPGAYDTLLEMTDAGLLARATVWAATDERCANQAFNINNGDLFRWNEMWPKIARFFGLEVAPPLSMSLDTVMADKDQLWNTMIEKYDLEPHAYKEVSSWAFGDAVFSWDYDFLADGSKARRFGFHEFVDSEAMFLDIFSDFRRRRIIP